LTTPTPCPECYGARYVSYDEAVPDYTHGGHIREVVRLCETCDGAGEIEEEHDA